MKVAVVGLGGIGTALLYPLARYLAHDTVVHSILLVDGDSYEKKNLSRQDIDEECLTLNKAKATMNRANDLFDRMEFRHVSEYVNRKNIDSILKGYDTILLCVDNHATRNIVQRWCETMDDIVLISGGNELTDGNIQVYLRRGGKDVTPKIYDYHPEIKNPADTTPDEMSCEELAENGSEQIIFTNLMAAVLMLNAFYALMKGEVKYTEVYFDILANKAEAVKRS